MSPSTRRSPLLLDVLIKQSTTSFLPYTLSKHQRKVKLIPTDVECSHIREQRCSVPGSSCRDVNFCILTSVLLYVIFILLYILFISLYILFYERIIQKSHLCDTLSLCRPRVHLLGDCRPSVHRPRVFCPSVHRPTVLHAAAERRCCTPPPNAAAAGYLTHAAAPTKIFTPISAWLRFFRKIPIFR